MQDHSTLQHGLELTVAFLLFVQTIESDFYATEAGRKHFSDQLTSIRYW